MNFAMFPYHLEPKEDPDGGYTDNEDEGWDAYSPFP